MTPIREAVIMLGERLLEEIDFNLESIGWQTEPEIIARSEQWRIVLLARKEKMTALLAELRGGACQTTTRT